MAMGYEAIFGALLAGNMARLDAVLREDPGAVHACSTWYTPLTLAAAKCNARAVRLLLRWGAAVNERSGRGLTALHYVSMCSGRNTYEPEGAVVRLLVSAGADVNL